MFDSINRTLGIMGNLLESDPYQDVTTDMISNNLGFTRSGVQRFQCKTCLKTFTATWGTIFFRKRTPEHQILETLALLAEGSRISSLTRAKVFKEDIILKWLREAAAYADQIEDVLMADFQIKRGQLDALWS